MRLLILSFFTVLLGYSLLFDQQEETKLIKRPQEFSPSSAVMMAPNASDSISYSYMNWLSITPGLHSFREQKPVFRCLK